MENLIKGKKGAIEDIILIIVTMFTLAIVMLVGIWLSNTFNSSIAPTFYNMSNISTVGFTSVNNIANNMFNYMYLAVFFVFVILLVISAFMTPTHPIFFAFSIILFIVLMIASVVLSNVYESITAVPAFSAAAAHLAIPNFLIGHLPLITAVIGVLLAIIIYSRSGFGAGGEAAVTR